MRFSFLLLILGVLAVLPANAAGPPAQNAKSVCDPATSKNCIIPNANGSINGGVGTGTAATAPVQNAISICSPSDHTVCIIPNADGSIVISGGGGGGVNTINTTCPTSSSTGTTITLSGGLSTTTRSPVSAATDTLLTGDCGGLTRYTGTGTTITVPAAGSTGFAANWATSLVNAGSGTLTINSSGGNFSSNGTTHISLAAGQSVMLQTDGINWNIVTNLVTSGTGGGATAPAPTPGSIRYYPIYAAQTAAGAAPVVGSTYCSPFWVQQPQHWDQLVVYLTTTGTGHSAVALYNDATDASGIHYPQNMQVNSGTTTEGASASTLTYTMPSYQIPQGLNWFCFQVDNITSRYLSFIGIGAANYVGGLIGSATLSHIVGSSGPAIFGYSYTGGTYGTWPANTGAGADIQNAEPPYLGYRVLSVP